MNAQLSLWEEPEEEETEEQRFMKLSLEQKRRVVFVCEQNWANGDTSPDALEKLSQAVLGNLRFCTNAIGDGITWIYHITTTGIVDGKVLIAYEYLGTKFEVFGWRETTGATCGHDEDEDDE